MKISIYFIFNNISRIIREVRRVDSANKLLLKFNACHMRKIEKIKLCTLRRGHSEYSYPVVRVGSQGSEIDPKWTWQNQKHFSILLSIFKNFQYNILKNFCTACIIKIIEIILKLFGDTCRLSKYWNYGQRFLEKNWKLF